jgi:hypothetical protein
LQRLNRSSEKFYFEFKDLKNIKVSPSEDMSKSVKLDFVAVCFNNVYILRGEIPESKEKRQNISANVKANRTKGAFLNMIEKHEDTDLGSYEFIATAALNKMQYKNKTDVIKDMTRFYGGNMLHSAFEILASHDYDDFFDEVYNDDEILKVHKELIKHFMPKENKISISKVNEALKGIYEKSTKGKKKGRHVNKIFLENLQKLYQSYSPNTMKADIASAYYHNNPVLESVDYAVDLMNSVDEKETSKNDENFDVAATVDNDEQVSYTPLVNNIYSSLIKSPFIGSYAKAAVPLLPVFRYKRHKIFKNEDSSIDRTETKKETDKSEQKPEEKQDEEINTSESEEETTKIKNKSKKGKKKIGHKSFDNEEDTEEEKLNYDFFK